MPNLSTKTVHLAILRCCFAEDRQNGLVRKCVPHAYFSSLDQSKSAPVVDAKAPSQGSLSSNNGKRNENVTFGEW